MQEQASQSEREQSWTLERARLTEQIASLKDDLSKLQSRKQQDIAEIEVRLILVYYLVLLICPYLSS